MNATSFNALPPSCDESQRQAQEPTGAQTVEEIGDKLLGSLRKQGLSNPPIKAIMEYVIRQLPPDTKTYICLSVKRTYVYNYVLGS